MKKLIMLLIIALIPIASSGYEPIECVTLKSPWAGPRVYRCENDEVICYYMKDGYNGGPSCKFKIPNNNSIQAETKKSSK